MKTQYSYKQHLGDAAPPLPRGYRWRIRRNGGKGFEDEYEFTLQKERLIWPQNIRQLRLYARVYGGYDQFFCKAVEEQVGS